MEINKLYKLLMKIPVFRGMEQKELENLLCFLEDEKFDMGDNILKEYENEEDTKMYVILEGGVEILKKAPSKDEEEVHLNILRPGESFGEMGLVDVMVRSATVRAIAPTRTFSLSKWNLNRLFELHPRVYGLLMRNIAQQISRRLRKADVFQASVLYKERTSKEKEKADAVEQRISLERKKQEEEASRLSEKKEDNPAAESPKEETPVQEKKNE